MYFNNMNNLNLPHGIRINIPEYFSERNFGYLKFSDMIGFSYVQMDH